MQYSTKFPAVTYNISLSASGHPSGGLVLFGEVLGQGLAPSQRMGEDLRY